ncbi:MAG: CARDB domain-containing protein, partial [Paracoccaceae bacterium]
DVTLSYTIEDENGDTDSATHHITVTPDDDILTEDVWFHGVPCNPNDIDGVKTEWKYHGGSDKLQVLVEIPLDGLFGDNAPYTFTDVDISAYEAVFANLGVTDFHKVKVSVEDDHIKFRLVAKNVVLSDAQIAALPDEVDTPVALMDVHGVTRWLDVCVSIDETTVHSPVAFDLNSDGVIGVTGTSTAHDRVDDTPGDAVYFDIDGNGTLDRIEWLSGDGDALLVDNRDGQAFGDMDGARLFGDEGGTYPNGYSKLADLDANTDDILTGAELEGLALWVDNGDAIVQAGEMHSVADFGITSITTTHDLVVNGAGETLMQSGADIGMAGLLTPSSAGKDLTIVSLSARDVSLSQGQTLKLDLDVANLGTDAAKAVKTTFYWQATDSFDSATAVVIGTDGHGRLDAGEIDTNEKFKLKYDQIAPLGDGYIFAQIDATHAHDELNEANNLSDALAITVAGNAMDRADLEVQSITARDATLEEGQKLILDLVVSNDGGTKARSVETTIYWNDTDSFDIATAVEIGTDGHGALSVGEVDSTEKVKIDYNEIEALGDGFIFAMIDAKGAHLESDETNNLSDSVAITLAGAGASDVTILDMDATQTTIADGDTFKVVLDVANIGAADADDTQSTLYWNATDTFDAATAVALAEANHRTLTAGEVDTGEKVRIAHDDVENLGSGWLFAMIDTPDGDADMDNNLSDGLFIDVL